MIIPPVSLWLIMMDGLFLFYVLLTTCTLGMNHVLSKRWVHKSFF